MKTKPKNYWKSIENVTSELLELEKILGRFPSISDIGNSGNYSLSIAIAKYHGGMNNIRSILNQKILKKPFRYWEDMENIKEESKKYVLRFGSDEFTYTRLRERKYNNLINGIKRQKISLSDVCDLINCKKNFTEKGYLEDKENIKNELRMLISKYGVYPPREILLQENKTSLEVIARKKFNGLNELLLEIGYKKPNKLSSLETCVKHKINNIFYNTEYIDNGRKKLLEYGVNLKNSATGQWFELDRYYYNLKLAVEIHGKQHYVGTSYLKYGHEVSDRTKKNDEIKRELLKKQGIDLIVIPYLSCSDEFIRTAFNQYIKT